MKTGATYEYIRPSWSIRPGKVIEATPIRFTVDGFDRKSRCYSVTFENGSKNAISQGSPMHRGSVEVTE